MNTIIFQAFRATVILGIAFFAFVSDALAAPVLTPATVTRVAENSATIIGHVSNPYKNSTVWFEVSGATGSPITYAVQSIWNEGTFEWNLRDLNQGETYSVRSVAMESGVTVYSPSSTFTTSSPKPVVLTTATAVSSGSTAKTAQPAQATQVATSAATTKKVATTSVVTTEGFTNNNSASVIGAGSGMLPSTLIGWIILLIAIFVVVLLGHMVHVSIEERKKALEEKKRKEEEAKNK